MPAGRVCWGAQQQQQFVSCGINNEPSRRNNSRFSYRWENPWWDPPPPGTRSILRLGVGFDGDGRDDDKQRKERELHPFTHHGSEYLAPILGCPTRAKHGLFLQELHLERMSGLKEMSPNRASSTTRSHQTRPMPFPPLPTSHPAPPLCNTLSYFVSRHRCLPRAKPLTEYAIAHAVSRTTYFHRKQESGSRSKCASLPSCLLQFPPPPPSLLFRTPRLPA